MTMPWPARLMGRPLALAPQALDLLIAAGLRAGSPHSLDLVPDPHYRLAAGGIAVVPVLGPLVARGDWLTQLLGASDYTSIAAAAEAAFAEPSTRAVLLELDSPGGEVGGLFDLVERLSALRNASGKPLWAAASESALSAAYAIASAADRIYVSRTAEVGSIGVVAAHLDESQADAMAGHKWTLIHAGERKIDGHAHAPLSAQAYAAVQADVDVLHGELVALVARNRRVAPEAVHDTQAAIYRGRRGIEHGLADRLGTLDGALAELAAQLEAGSDRRAFTSPTHASRRQTAMIDDAHSATAEQQPASTVENAPQASEERALPATLEPTPPPGTLEPPEPVTANEAPPEETAEQLRAEYAEIAAVAAQGARLGVTLDAADAMVRGIGADALRRSLLDTLAARAEAQVVVATAPQQAAPTESPLVRRARERAAATLPRSRS